MTITQEAVEAAAQSIYKTSWYGDVPLRWGEIAEASKIFYRQRAAACLAEVLPAIEKQIREQVAADIWEYWDACGDLIDDRDSARQAIDAIAAQIAKGADHA